ncbi:myxosortase-dependent M36 family metallopeptidase [Stigmatella sp. ncwal1]|uniref:Myxosortase-dependent M36 family metallopeptidase n=1 Tax=Stigmatella ashevillensis TaxID=2995309 RepID=A0ABT5D4P9_9BACT|nr:myxosortase-dependent M36 family metallopeptidase [Stigmatella ashevillena]MDC0708641.1 myxosortase-dependent M36 family metallopeptidase [Stigmatella ashevillena]
MKRWVFSVAGLVLVLPGLVGARELPALDVSSESVSSRPLMPSHRPSRVPGARVVSTDPRSGSPTWVWGLHSGVDPRFLSAVKRMGPEQAARAHLARLSALYGLAPETAATVPATVGEPPEGRGAVLVTFRQELEGIELFRESLKVLMNEHHELIALSGHLSAHVAPGSRAGRLRFTWSAQEAIAAAYADLHGVRPESSSLVRQGPAQGGDTFHVFTPAASARSPARLLTPVRARRVFFSLPDRLIPAWYVELHTQVQEAEADYYSYVIAADDGRLLFRHNLTASDTFSFRVWADPFSPFLPHDGPQGHVGTPHPTGIPDGYQAPVVPPEAVTLSNSPFSRNDPWLPVGASETVGNNVDAYVDISGSDGRDGSDFRASLSGPSTFDRVYDVTLEPGASAQQRMAAVTQLFYVTNFLHDWYYDAGFTEATGNAQQDNYGRGGLGNDVLLAEAQEFSGLSTSSMSTPADGARPKMQMYVFAPNPRQSVTVISPPEIAGKKGSRWAAFGPKVFDVEGELVLAKDGMGSPTDGCQVQQGTPAGKILLIDRGTCSDPVKVKNAQNAGALGVIIAHNLGGPPPDLTGTDASITTPVLSIDRVDGNALKAQLLNGPVTVRLLREPAVHRDGALDNSLVAHEWGHYMSNRLIANANGLTNNQGRAMGEGWADFHALLMMARAEDAQLPGNVGFTGAYAVGGHVSGGGENDGYYFGLRRYPYSSSFNLNPLTFRYIANGVALPITAPSNPRLSGLSNAAIHNSGEVWASMLWECYTSLLRDSARLSFEEAQRRMKRYLVLSYQLTPVAPTFLEARDALLAAVLAESWEDFRLFHTAFARRGAGLRAVAPPRDSLNHAGVVESFASGKDVGWGGAELVEAPGSCDNDGVVDPGETGLLRVTIDNTGIDTVSATTVQVQSTDPGVTIGQGGQLVFPPIAPFASATVDIPVTVEGPAEIRFITFQITYQDADQAIPGARTVSFSERVNVDELPASSATDDVESRLVTWTMTKDASLGHPTLWSRHSETPVVNYFFGPNASFKADIALMSPPLHVSAVEDFRFTFIHRFEFEADSFDLLDGGVMEISTDNGVTWTDIGASATPGYTDILYAFGTNPLAGRPVYGDISEGYPAWVPVTVDLGNQYAGQTVRIRFRIGTDVSVGAAGWDIDNLSFSGLTHTPFSTLGVEPSVCVNTPPVAQAGPDQTVLEGTQVTLSGSGTDPDGDPVTYAWRQTSGPEVVLGSTDTAQTGFTAPEVSQTTVLAFALTVNDNRGASGEDGVSITVEPKEEPVPDAGPVEDGGPEDGGGPGQPDGGEGPPDGGAGDAGPGADGGSEENVTAESGCGCATGEGSLASLMPLLLGALGWRSRRRFSAVPATRTARRR